MIRGGARAQSPAARAGAAAAAAAGAAAGGGGGGPAVPPAEPLISKSGMVMLMRFIFAALLACITWKHGFFAMQLTFFAFFTWALVAIAQNMADDDEQMAEKTLVFVVCMLVLGMCACCIPVYDCAGKHIPTDKTIKNHWIAHVQCVYHSLHDFGEHSNLHIDEKTNKKKWPNCFDRTINKWDACKLAKTTDKRDKELSCKTN